jgi:hypothetical protein
LVLQRSNYFMTQIKLLKTKKNNNIELNEELQLSNLAFAVDVTSHLNFLNNKLQVSLLQRCMKTSMYSKLSFDCGKIN